MPATIEPKGTVFTPAARILKASVQILDRVPVLPPGHYRSLPAQVSPSVGSGRVKPAGAIELPVGVKPSAVPLAGQRGLLDDASLDPTVPSE